MLVFSHAPVGDGGLCRSSPLTWVSSFREPSVAFFHAPRRRWSLWRFASLIPSGCRLPPIHKVMGDHASRDSTSAGASSATWSCQMVFSVTCASLHQILDFHLMGWRDAATLRFCKGLICKGLSKRGVEMWPKNGCVSTLLLNCYLIISELRIHPWPRPDWRLGC